jgi:hypothetical protein
MTSHFDAIMALLGIVIGLLSTLITVVWKARGYVDRLNTTDSRLADAIDALRQTQTDQHQANLRRFESLERRIDRGRPPQGSRAYGPAT